MVNRDEFDEWLRDRAAKCGAQRITGTFETVTQDPDGVAVVNYLPKGADKDAPRLRLRARVIVGADGAKSKVALQCVKGAEHIKYVFAYHEIIKAPAENFDPDRCDVYYQGKISPDFYGWVFPHGKTASVGSGSAQKGFSLRDVGQGPAGRGRADGCGDDPGRGRADTDAADEALGQRQGRGAGGRCRGRGGSGVGRGHLLRDGRRAAGRRGGGGVPGDRQCRGTEEPPGKRS